MITAVWCDLEPGTVIERDLHEITVATPDDVQALVQRLAEPHTSDAILHHASRPTRFNKITGKTHPDHEVTIAVCDGFGYIEYSQGEYWCQPIGNPLSPEWYTTNSDIFYAGSDIPLGMLVEAVTEFLETAERPTCVRWRENDEWSEVRRQALSST